MNISTNLSKLEESQEELIRGTEPLVHGKWHIISIPIVPCLQLHARHDNVHTKHSDKPSTQFKTSKYV